MEDINDKDIVSLSKYNFKLSKHHKTLKALQKSNNINNELDGIDKIIQKKVIRTKNYSTYLQKLLDDTIDKYYFITKNLSTNE